MSSDDVLQLRDADAVPIASQLSHAIQAGLPLESGLRALAEQTRSARTRRALLNLATNLEAGTPLADALANSASGLPMQMRVLVKAGMESGRLDTVLQYCIEQMQRAASLRQHIWLSLSYPIFLIWFSTCICGTILFAIVPTFKEMFSDFGTDLPMISQAIIALSTFLLYFGWEPWLVLMIGLPICYFFITIFGVSVGGRYWITSIPLVGRVFRYAALMDFCQILATLIESGLPFCKSLQFAGMASDDRWLRQKSQRITADVDQGEIPSIAAGNAGLPNTLCQVLREADSTRTFVDALRGMADIYAAQCNVMTHFTNTIFAQFSVGCVIGFAAITMISLFYPMMKMLRDLS